MIIYEQSSSDTTNLCCSGHWAPFNVLKRLYQRPNSIDEVITTICLSYSCCCPTQSSTFWGPKQKQFLHWLRLQPLQEIFKLCDSVDFTSHNRKREGGSCWALISSSMVHTFRVLSSLQEARNLPYGSHLLVLTSLVCPFNDLIVFLSQAGRREFACQWSKTQNFLQIS